MNAHDFWMQVLVHFTAIVLGGLKLTIISGVAWYIIRKKYLAKWMKTMMNDLMGQMGGGVVPAGDPIPGEGSKYPGHSAYVAPVPVAISPWPAFEPCKACSGTGSIHAPPMPPAMKAETVGTVDPFPHQG